MQQAQLQLQQQPVKPGSYKSEAGFGYQSGYAGQAGVDAGQAYSLNKNASTGGITSEEEKNHVIRVLEHESKVYRLEKNLTSMLGGGQDFDVYSEQGRSPYQQRNVRGYDV